eukprot:UN27356
MDGHLLPRLFLPATMKCGSSTLARQLNSQPNLTYGSLKEHAYFNHRKSKNMTAFIEEFPLCDGYNENHIVSLDGTPVYEYQSSVIKDFYPPHQRDQLIFLFVFCDPVGRFSSHYHHNVRLEKIPREKDFKT